MTSSCTRRGLDHILGKNESLKGLSIIGTGCTGNWWSCYPLGCFKDKQMWQGQGSHGSVRLTVGVNQWLMVLEVFSKKTILWFYDSVTFWHTLIGNIWFSAEVPKWFLLNFKDKFIRHCSFTRMTIGLTELISKSVF